MNNLRALGCEQIRYEAIPLLGAAMSATSYPLALTWGLV
ncbi:Hypothetical protein I595_1678 [Croceitalea dokdonensis DOKDO 023]|uniref:Uncharacterized protein n=1 Tax=Croceitalea dokdonensis DOKDO 023 TaxID=1300341 RepID=A0A0P7AZM4_9FLAO|nr:Hypothetical protein I595_1678 [Croceitalea dokdonensis DOKDO 023]